MRIRKLLAREHLAARIVAICLATLCLYLVALPLMREHIVIRVEGEHGTVELEGERHPFAVPADALYVSLPQADPVLREFQIDGSDSTNNQTLDVDFFRRIASTPYYRFESWMRDTSSFNRWENVRLRDASGRDLAPPGDVAAIEATRLPASYVVEADVFRLETTTGIRLSSKPDGGGAGVAVVIDRNDHIAGVQPLGTLAAPSWLASWYFPKDPVPFSATHVYTLVHVVLWGVVLLLVAASLSYLLALASAAVSTPLVARGLHPQAATRRGLGTTAGDESPRHETGGSSPAAHPDSDGRRFTLAVSRRACGAGSLFRAAVVAVASLASIGLILYVADADFQQHPHIFDAAAYYFQGSLFSTGHLWARAPTIPRAFDGPFTVAYGGRWFSQYPPGTGLVLALGFKAGAPWLVEPLLAMATLLGLYLTARMTSGRAVATLTLLLAALSPFLVLQSGSFLSHPVSLFLLTWAYFAAVRFRRDAHPLWGAATFALLGLAFLTRELAAVLFGAPLLLWTVIPALRRLPTWRVRLARLLPGALVGLAGLALYLLYNAALTGDPFLPPRNVVNFFDRLGFGDGIGFYGRHTPAAGLLNIDEMLASLQFTLYGWPYYCTLAFLPMPFLVRRSTTWDRLNLAIFLAFLAGYTAYFYHGIALGPRYLYESLPALVQLTARGVECLAAVAGASAARLVRKRPATGWSAACAVLAALLACNLLYFMPRQIELYRQYTYLPYEPSLDLTAVYEPAVHHAVAVTTDGRLYQTTLFPLNSPTLDGDVVWAYKANQGVVDQLRARYAGRSFYYVDVNDKGQVQLVPLGGSG